MISPSLLEIMAMVISTGMMVDMRGERPVRTAAVVRMRADNEATV